MNTNMKSKADKTATACQKTAEIIHCEIRDQFGDVESAGTVLTSLEAYHWYENHGANFDCAKMNDSGFTFQRPPEAIESGATLDALLAKHPPLPTEHDCPECGEHFSTCICPPQAEHSPLPWEHNATQPFTRYDGEREHGYACAIWTTKGEKPIATTNFSVGKWKALSPEVQDANAKLIVASVNHAEALAEALRAWEYAGNEGGISMVDWFEVARKKTREALANWEGAK